MLACRQQGHCLGNEISAPTAAVGEALCKAYRAALALRVQQLAPGHRGLHAPRLAARRLGPGGRDHGADGSREPWPYEFPILLAVSRRPQTCQLRQRATSAPAEGPAYGLEFVRHCEFSLRALQAQKWHVFTEVSRLVPPRCEPKPPKGGWDKGGRHNVLHVRECNS